MKPILRISRAPTWPLTILATCAFFFILTILEFGSTPLRSTVCRAVYSKTPTYTANTGELAPSVNASTLMANLLAKRAGRRTVSSISPGKVIHQSWRDRDPPSVYLPLTDSWRSTYPDWTYVLWNDDDNLALVETFFPEWRGAYDALPSGIYRADFARNLYMQVVLYAVYTPEYTFGGIYADLDSEAISPLRPLLDAQASANSQDLPIAFLGAMETHSHELHGVPNAFAASSAPGHPLWLLVAQDAVDWSRARSWDHSIPTPGPEYVTGPVALRRSLLNYWPSSLESTTTTGDQSLVATGQNATLAPVVVFPPEVIYPFSWDRSRPQVLNAAQECVCWMEMPTFNPGACKRMTGAQWVINYWNHGW